MRSLGINFITSETRAMISSSFSISSVLGFMTPRPRIQLFLIMSLLNNDDISPARGVENSRVRIFGKVSSNKGNKGV